MKFTAPKPHTVHPNDSKFAAQVEYFDSLCRVVRGLRSLTVGVIGARTTAFKTVRIDELTLQKHGVTVETFDLSGVLARTRALTEDSRKAKEKAQRLMEYTCWDGVPQEALRTLAKLAVVIDELIDENRLDAIALRCWLDLETELGISPCVLLSELNDRGIAAACELDIGNAVTRRALSLASRRPAICLDWNNNYGQEEDKCILFHCGSVPRSLMSDAGRITGHEILKTTLGEGRAYGCNVGRIATMPFTYGSLLSEGGKLHGYLGEGRFTEDPIPPEFFGCAGVAHIPNLQDTLQTIGYLGFRHQVSVAPGRVKEPVREALSKYLGYQVSTV